MERAGEPAGGQASAASTTPIRPRLPEVRRASPKLGNTMKLPGAAQHTPSPSAAGVPAEGIKAQGIKGQRH